VIIAVAENPTKKALFTVEERVGLIREVLADNDKASVDTFDGLLIDYVLPGGFGDNPRSACSIRL